ncbi:hypothetical protein AAMO2058_001167500 [Amorphochlora amoebiformis]
MLAARIIVSIENPEDVVAVSGVTMGQRAVYKFAQNTGSSYIASRYTPGCFTNQIQKKFMEPRLLLVTDPFVDHQPIKEAAYSNIPVIALCDTNSNTRFIDVVIPCNNKSKHSLALMYWLLAREVNRLRKAISRAEPWDVVVDLFMYREAEEEEKKSIEETPAAAETENAEAKEKKQDAFAAPSAFAEIKEDATAFGPTPVVAPAGAPEEAAKVQNVAFGIAEDGNWGSTAAPEAAGSWGDSAPPMSAGN